RERAPGGDRIGDLSGRRGGVPDRRAHAGCDEMFDEAHRAGDFRRKRDEDDAAAGGILAAIEVVDGRGLHVLSRMRAPGAILRRQDRKSTRLNSSHRTISYAVFCLKKKKKNIQIQKSSISSCPHM